MLQIDAVYGDKVSKIFNNGTAKKLFYSFIKHFLKYFPHNVLPLRHQIFMNSDRSFATELIWADIRADGLLVRRRRSGLSRGRPEDKMPASGLKQSGSSNQPERMVFQRSDDGFWRKSTRGPIFSFAIDTGII